MNVAAPETLVSEISAAIAEPARTCMLYCLLDGHSRTATELGVVAGVSPSTASVHLARLRAQQLVKVMTQGKYRYYSLAGTDVASLLEALAVMAGGARHVFEPSTPVSLRAARSCYDHLAGALGVALHQRLLELHWLSPDTSTGNSYVVTSTGEQALAALGLDFVELHAQRRRFAYACLDWSERQPHLAGALGAALLQAALRRKWLVRELDSRVLRLTPAGKREFKVRFGVQVLF
ncbi:MAG: helix-turn-helix transcriptional regulator [Gammaproteobacteria bacterium]|nr:helix-turn-helix transcriptional regulator [Gammaproteobacteria bacterium]MDE2345677.1 helix-turn-helix transcriptional regulator [Gammaproteobacteria bacterium]